MLEMMKSKELELKQLCSRKTESIEIAGTAEALTAYLKENLKGEAVAVCWFMQKIVFGRWNGDGLTLPADGDTELCYLQEARIFNEESEVHLRALGGSLHCTTRRDGEGSSCWYADSCAPLWGERVSAEEGMVTLKDSQRGMELSLPAADSSAKKYGLVTRNYVAEDEATGLSGYGDYRYLAIVALEE